MEMFLKKNEIEDYKVELSIVIPVYNSAKMLQELHDRLTKVLTDINRTWEIIFVDDCGPDNSWEVLKDIKAHDDRVVLIQLMRNSGQGAATLCGLSQTAGKIVLTMDDDLQHPPEEIPSMIKHLESKIETDIVLGIPKKKEHSFIRRMGSDFINWSNSILLNKPKDLRFTSFRIMRREVVEGLLTQRHIYPAIGPLLLSVTKRIENLIVRHDPRKEGKSAYNLSRIIKQTMSNFIGFSMLPLRILAILGAIGIIISIVIAIVILIKHYIIGVGVPGWTSIILLVTILSGFNFFAFSILGEYVLRILQLVNRTPVYLIRRKID